MEQELAGVFGERQVAKLIEYDEPRCIASTVLRAARPCRLASVIAGAKARISAASRC